MIATGRQRGRRKAIPGANIIVFALILLAAGSANAEYRLGRGDILEIVVMAGAELRSRAQIDLDGIASFPAIGRITAAGLTLAEIQANVKDVLPTKVFRRRLDDGREYPVVLGPDEVTITIAEYRPVYVNGDVSKPGQEQFRPGMTVRQAIALAGGYDVLRFRAKDPFLESADLQAEYTSLWTEYAAEQARNMRLRVEIGEKAKLEHSDLGSVPIPTSILAEIQTFEREQLAGRTADHQKEIDHVREELSITDKRITSLNSQRLKDLESADADADDFERTRQNLQKGIVPMTRLIETRRLAIFSAMRVLQTGSMVAEVESKREELSRKLARTEDHRRLELLSQLQESLVKLAALRARLRSVGDKLVYTGIVKSQLRRGRGGKTEIQIIRDQHAGKQHLVADEDTLLLPGDVVEVALQLESAMTTAEGHPN